MLRNLGKALYTAFGDRVITKRVPDGMLAIQIDGIELVINERGEIHGASRVGSAGLEVDVDRFGGAIPPASPTVEASV